MTLALLKYNAGNTASVSFALQRLGVEAVWTDDPLVLKSADKVIIPGVGAAEPAMEYLRARKLDECIRSLTQPVLGVCIGLQLFCERSEEDDTECLGIFPVEVQRFQKPRKIPHMGWNALTDLKGSLFSEVQEGAHAYFVHSYRAPITEYTVAQSSHEEEFSAALQKDNFCATQFHVEKSGVVGEKILKGFLSQ